MTGSSFISTRSSTVDKAGVNRAAIISVARTMVRLRSFDIDVTGAITSGEGYNDVEFFLQEHWGIGGVSEVGSQPVWVTIFSIKINP